MPQEWALQEREEGLEGPETAGAEATIDVRTEATPAHCEMSEFAVGG